MNPADLRQHLVEVNEQLRRQEDTIHRLSQLGHPVTVLEGALEALRHRRRSLIGAAAELLEEN
jgi:hypothetical protein